MSLEENIRIALNKQYGDFVTPLEKEYERKIIDRLLTEEKDKWVTYNQVIIELKNSIQDVIKVRELQYKLTEENNHRKVCMDLIKTVDRQTPELYRLYHKIKNF